jgi:hypothetical protein
MATLSNPTFQVDTLTGMPSDYRVWGTVTVELTPFENSLIQMGYPLYLQSNIWADDTSSIALAEGPSPSDYRNNTDDLLFSYTNQTLPDQGLTELVQLSLVGFSMKTTTGRARGMRHTIRLPSKRKQPFPIT